MKRSVDFNFAARLVKRLGVHSDLIDAATGECLSAAELPNRIAGAADAMRRAGLTAGDRIVIVCALNPATAVVYLGALYAGLVVLPLEERTFHDAGEALYRKVAARAVWSTQPQRLAWLPDGGIGLSGWLPPSPATDLPPAACRPGDLAALMPTSGSTGVPRLVRVTHGNLIANTEAIIRSQSLQSDERAMLILPISYCFGASILHTHLYKGGGVVCDSRFMFPDKVLRAIDQYGCTTFAGVPTAYTMLLGRSSLRRIPLPTLRRFLQAGGALAPQSVCAMCDAVPKARFFVMYGQTEATARISCLPPDHLATKLGSAGRVLDNLTVRIADEAGNELPRGETGEIWVSGPSVCDGYFEDDEATTAKFRNGWLRTGDLASLDEDEFLWIKGRRGDFLKMRGVRVSLAEVEARVTAVPGVLECAATAVPHAEAGEAMRVFVVPLAGDAVVQVADRVRHALPPHWTCAGVQVVANLPKNANGKIDRLHLGKIP